MVPIGFPESESDKKIGLRFVFLGILLRLPSDSDTATLIFYNSSSSLPSMVVRIRSIHAQLQRQINKTHLTGFVRTYSKYPRKDSGTCCGKNGGWICRLLFISCQEGIKDLKTLKLSEL